MAASASPTAARLHWTWGDTVTALLLAIGAATVCVAAIVRRPDLNFGIPFLFADPGANLLIAERLSEGARLYRDVGFSYGPLAIYPYAWFTRLVGNTPQAYASFLATFSVVNVVLAFALLRRRVSRSSATIVVAGGLYATLVLPGSLISGGLPSPYFVLERLLFLAILLSWRPPRERTMRCAAVVGLLLGASQGVRFGTAFFIGAAIVIVDLLALHVASADRAAVMHWVRRSLVTLSCFLVVQGAWVILAYALLPSAEARDFLWPAYILEGFEVWPSEYRWPRFEGFRLFVGQQLLGIGCAVLALEVLWWGLRGGARDRARGIADRLRVGQADLVMVIPFAFYVIGAAALFRGVYHFYQYAWTLPLAAALAVDRRGRRFAAVFLVVCLPALALVVRANFVSEPPGDAVVVRPPRGGLLMLSPVEKRRVDAIREYATVPVNRSLIVMRTGAGFHHLYGTRFSGRQLFYILGFARGDDANAMLHTLESEPSAMVLTDYPAGESPSADPCTWYGWQHFAKDVCPRLAELVDTRRAIQVDETTWIIPGVMTGEPARDPM
jgi:hypothetical protein